MINIWLQKRSWRYLQWIQIDDNTLKYLNHYGEWIANEFNIIKPFILKTREYVN